MFFFFFSSRRRHTRSDRDWSSDVCSSDLQCLEGRLELLAARREVKQGRRHWRRRFLTADEACLFHPAQPFGQEVGGNPGEAVPKVRVPARAEDQELADDQERPTVADNIEPLGERAVLPV